MTERALPTAMHDGMDLRQRPLVVRRWWLFAFIVSLMVCLSALLFLDNEAHAKPTGGDHGGSNSGGRVPNSGGHSGSEVPKSGGNSGGDFSNSGAHSGSEAPNSGGHSGNGGSGKAGNSGGEVSNSEGHSGRESSSGGAKETPRNQGHPDPAGGQRKDFDLGEANRPAITRGDADSSLGDSANGATSPSNDTVPTSGGTTSPIEESPEPLGNQTSPASRPLGSTPSPVSEVDNPVVLPGAAAPKPTAMEAEGGALEQILQVRAPLPTAEVFPLSDQPSSWSSREQSMVSQPVLLSAPILTEEASNLPAGNTLVAISASADDHLGTGPTPGARDRIESALSDDNLTALDLFAGVEGVLTQVPESLPDGTVAVRDSSGGPRSFPAGGLPAAAVGSSGGSNSSSSSAGFELLGTLALLSILLVRGKHLWEARGFLKPSLVVLPALERPG